MTDIHKSHIAALEEVIRQNPEFKNVFGTADLPYPNLESVQTAYRKNELRIGATINQNLMRIIASRPQRRRNARISLLHLLMVLSIIVVSIVYSNWWLLLGLILVYSGNFTSSPYFRKRNLLLFFSIVGLIISAIYLSWTWTALISIFVLSTLIGILIRYDYSKTIINNALNSDVIFSWLFIKGEIQLFDNITGKSIYSPRLAERLRNMGMSDGLN